MQQINYSLNAKRKILAIFQPKTEVGEKYRKEFKPKIGHFSDSH